RAAMLGIELKQLEVSVNNESDARGIVGIPNAPAAFDNMRMSIKIGADGVEEYRLRELATWAEAHSPVSCTLRDSPPVTLDISVVGAGLSGAFRLARCPLMGWSGRAPAPPASEAGKGRHRQGALHVSDTQYRDSRDWHRYRQELVPRRGP